MDEQQRISSVASSSNSSFMLSSKKYDVFLSFRGEDTRLNFTSHLYKALNEKKVETYIDNRLQKGDEISTALTKAIEDSYVSIVIFSKNYASSKWCLGELSKILECKKVLGQIVIPVFYDIDPSHVRNQDGSYGQAFAKHEGDPRCNKWREDLTEAANLAGWDSRNRTEPEFLEDIARDVLQKLPPRYLNQLKGLVGIEENYEQIESLLKIGSSEVKTLGIWGMGGTGKTTLATALYDKLSCEFEGSCFLANVREKSDKLEDLRDKLFSKLLANKNFDYSEMSRLPRKKVFIVLDDVETSGQLEKLIGEYDFLGLGSRVIVTTRNKQILRPGSEIFPVRDLSPDHSLQLFCLAAFGEKQPEDGYEDLSRAAISYCKGIPLALKVLGANLRSRSKEAWQFELRKLQKIPDMKIYKVLKLSYDGLDRLQQNIFLDIACFFKGENKDYVTRALEAFDFFPQSASGIDALVDKALITISEYNRIEMHDLIQDMGREIVHQESIRDPGRRSRLWKHEEVLDVLKLKYEGTDIVEGIILDLQKLNGDLYLSSDSLAKMTNVRFFKIHNRLMQDSFNAYLLNALRKMDQHFNVYLSNGLESFSDKLRYLSWDGCCLESLPTNFCVEQLVVLSMRYSKLKKLWDGVQNLVNLKSIDLYGSQDLIKIPDLSKAEKLEKLHLGKCESMRQLHPSKLSFPKLTYLNLDECREIEILNVDSKSLGDLHLIGCSSLKEFSVTSEEMSCLCLSDCRKLMSLLELPPSLELLFLNDCRELVFLPELPPSLEQIWLNDCKKLVSPLELPPSLKELYLNGCSELVSLPELPPSLKGIYLNGCWKLMSLPELPPSLIELDLNGCSELLSLPELPPSLEQLYLNDCRKLMSLPELPPSLQKLSLYDCSELVSLPELPPSLKQLSLYGCRKLLYLPELPPSLKQLSLYDCRKLLYLSELPPSLYKLMTINCTSLETEITQRLVLQHMLQSFIPYYFHQQYLNNNGYFLIPGDHVTDHDCGFRTVESSITIPYLPKTHLRGFIYCIILSEGHLFSDWVSCSIYQDSKRFDGKSVRVGFGVDRDGGADLILDHMLFWYHDVSEFCGISEVYDYFSNVTFKFKSLVSEERIKGCGVFPVYATASGLSRLTRWSVETLAENIGKIRPLTRWKSKQ